MSFRSRLYLLRARWLILSHDLEELARQAQRIADAEHADPERRQEAQHEAATLTAAAAAARDVHDKLGRA